MAEGDAGVGVLGVAVHALSVVTPIGLIVTGVTGSASTISLTSSGGRLEGRGIFADFGTGSLGIVIGLLPRHHAIAQRQCRDPVPDVHAGVDFYMFEQGVDALEKDRLALFGVSHRRLPVLCRNCIALALAEFALERARAVWLAAAPCFS